MSDPFSVASGAVGVISLGLQNLATKAEQLRAPLKDLRELIEETRDSSPETANDSKEKTNILQSYVDRLKEAVERVKPAASQSIRGKARAGLKKAVYPFEKDTLFEIGACLDGMQFTIQTTLMMFMTRRTVKLVSRQEIFASKQDVIVSQQDTIIAGIETLKLSIESSSPRAMLQQPPARIKDWRDKLDYPGWMVTVPRKAQNRRAKEITKQYSYYSRWLNFLATGSFYLSLGSGVVAIAPYLHFHAVHGPESWLGKLLDQYSEALIFKPMTEGLEEAEFSSLIDQMIKQLQEGLSVGKVAATDSVSHMYSRVLGGSHGQFGNFPLIQVMIT
ncbi:hypothetical protein N7478_010916 [Penicillium angulare]|uniref:uncharacterized protein n=1 Tax=Penicillium angulare TaxID=116970 RepID=UPI0025402531|nr:uncharacterized protein N7478_010916 [Penicillium angulare]KAJ5263311.1 hypothetical protein N7478_010916 [Penicillium angulare]